MADYDLRAQALAARLLAPKAAGGKGQQITLVHQSAGTYDPATSQLTGAGAVTQITSGVVSEYKEKSRGGLQRIDGSLVQSGDRNIRISPVTVDGSTLAPGPQLDDTVTLATGQSYTITQVSIIAPAGLTLYYDCNIRGVT
ncbi:hypothetical protein [Phenylobacterium conjunctum]|uniref:Uncharacterized protein n=1 Tax=Phenylobacterium conjunctum TaxID=1298959 RepID=A0ABW3SYQ8_9CAUL